VLILSGSPIVGSFDFRVRVDFVRIPGVIKLHNGEYTSLGLHIDLEQTLEMRASIIHHTAKIFAPDLFLVDKEPLGLKGEIAATLAMLKERNTVNVLGLRDVMDEPNLLRREWERKKVLPALDDLYDDIWVYGPAGIGNPLAGLDIPDRIAGKMKFTGYLPRTVPQASTLLRSLPIEEPYLLVTTGGGGDGATMLDWVLRAYEQSADLPYPGVLVLGPFMQPSLQREFLDRVERLERVTALTFDTHIEVLMERAAGIVAMGGYNTFCEILSFDKRALLIPRSAPRREQLLRARRAQALGLVQMLDAQLHDDAAVMAKALREMPSQKLPSEAEVTGLLSGLTTLNNLVEGHILGRKGRELQRPQSVP
jgi:predicted glycosyltransferase